MRTNPALPLLLITTLAVGGAGCGAEEGTFKDCYYPGVCPGNDSECAQRTCESGRCGMRLLESGTVLVTQFAGDCRLRVCDGTGAAVNAVDDSDVPAGQIASCLVGACAAGVPSSIAVTPGSSCWDPVQASWGACDAGGVCLP